MSDDYKRGLIMGMAMQPLPVAKIGGEPENRCVNQDVISVGGFVSDEGFCEYIEVQH